MAAAKIYERLAAFDTEEINKGLVVRDEADYRRKIEAAFPDSFEIMWNEFKKKIPVLQGLASSLIPKWDEIRKEAFSLVYPADKIRTYLKEAGCPVRFSEIGVDKKLTSETIANARYIR